MINDVKIPLSLKIVAYLFLLGGIWAAVEIVAKLARGIIFINLGILSIPICWGLLNRRNGWRICGLVFIWIGLIGIPIIFLLSLFASGQGHFEVFGMRVGRLPVWVISVVCVPIFLLALWEYHVLVRPSVKALFKPPLNGQSPYQRGEKSGMIL